MRTKLGRLTGRMRSTFLAFHLLGGEPARWARPDPPRVRLRRVRIGRRKMVAEMITRLGNSRQPLRPQRNCAEKALAAIKESVFVAVLIICIINVDSFVETW